MTAGSDLIAAERERQIAVEGWTPEHDDEHADGELAEAAICYLLRRNDPNNFVPPQWWPWEPSAWKQSDDPLRNLIKAGALVAAEIDRLVRAGRGSSGE